MPTRRPLDLARELVESFEAGARATEYLVETLPDAVWRAKPPDGGARSIAAIVAHVQSVRRTFAKMGGAPQLAALDRSRSTRKDAVAALRRSREALTAIFEETIAQGRGRAGRMPRRAVNMMHYLLQHDAHHRGQMLLLARALGHRTTGDTVMRLWGWKKLPGE